MDKKLLTPRQKALYKFLEEHPDKTFTKRTICNVIRDEEGETMYRYKDDIRNSCPEIWGDVEAINMTGECQLVFYKNHQIRLANKKDIGRMISKEVSYLRTHDQRLANILAKCRRHNNFFFNLELSAEDNEFIEEYQAYNE